MKQHSTIWISLLMQFLEHSENIVFIQADEEGKIINCNLALMRFLRRDERPIGAFVEDIFISPNGERVKLSDQYTADSPIPEIVKLKGSLLLFKMVSFRHDSGKIIFAERIGGGEDMVLQTMSCLTNELVNISRELAKRNQELREAKEQIEAISRTDYLTGLANRRYFMERLEEAVSLAKRHSTPLSIIIADLDHFKQVNDTYGHEAGDKVLKHFGEILKQNCRREDLPARMGGEEFVLLLPQTTKQGALQFGTRICEIMRQTDVLGRGSPVTVSMGVAELAPQDDTNQLLKRADNALYAAKAKGRDCVISAE